MGLKSIGGQSKGGEHNPSVADKVIESKRWLFEFVYETHHWFHWRQVQRPDIKTSLILFAQLFGDSIPSFDDLFVISRGTGDHMTTLSQQSFDHFLTDTTSATSDDTDFAGQGGRDVSVV